MGPGSDDSPVLRRPLRHTDQSPSDPDSSLPGWPEGVALHPGSAIFGEVQEVGAKVHGSLSHSWIPSWFGTSTSNIRVSPRATPGGLFILGLEQPTELEEETESAGEGDRAAPSGSPKF